MVADTGRLNGLEVGKHGCGGPQALALSYPSVRTSEVVYEA